MTKQMVVSNQSKITKYLRSAPIVQRFEEVIGDKNAAPFIASVLLQVSQSDKLQSCSPQSIASSAMRAAVMKLSCDPTYGEAYLVPYKNKCTFIPGYKGYQAMAYRTGRYKHLNVAKITKSQTITEDQFTGLHTIKGHYDRNEEAQGYMLYFELFDGFKKTYYMSVEEILAHAERYSPSYRFKDSIWKKHPETMMKKTVFRQGMSKLGRFDPDDRAMLGYDEDQDEGNQAQLMGELPSYEDLVVDGEIVDAPDKPRETDVVMGELGYDDERPKSTITKKAERESKRPYIKSEGDLAGYKQLAQYHGIEEEVYMAILRECDNDAVKAGEALVGQVPPEQESML